VITGNAVNSAGIAFVVVEKVAFNQPDIVDVLQNGKQVFPVGFDGVRTREGLTQEVAFGQLVDEIAAIALSPHPSKKRSQQAATKIMTLNLLLTVSYQK
jgi:hypothetical protein